MENEKLYSVTMTEEELKLFSEFLAEQKEYAVKHYAPASERDALAKKARQMRAATTPEAITADKAKRMKAAGYPKHFIQNTASADNVKPFGTDLSKNERLQRAGNERVRQYINKESALLEDKYKPKYTPDKFR
jgi:hypothetical protein